MSGLIENLGGVTDRDIQRMVNHAQREKGLSFHRNQFIDDLKWEIPNQKLVARVNENLVSLEAKGEEVIFICECSYFQRTGNTCSHGAALLFTACNLLNPKRFGSLMWSNRKREKMEVAFRSADVRETLTREMKRKAMLLLRRGSDGQPLGEERGIPESSRSAALDDLLYFSWGWKEEHTLTILEELKRGIIEIRILTDEGEVPVEKSLDGVSLEQVYDLVGTQLIRRRRPLHGGIELDGPWMQVANNLLFFSATKTLALLEDSDEAGASSERLLLDNDGGDEPSSFREEASRVIELKDLGWRDLPSGTEEATLLYDGRPVEVEAGDVDAVFEIRPTDDGRLLVSPISSVGSMTLMPFGAVRDQMTVYQGYGYPSQMGRAKKRRQFIQQSFFLQALLDGEERVAFQRRCSEHEMIQTQFLDKAMSDYLQEGEGMLARDHTVFCPIAGEGWRQNSLALRPVIAGTAVFIGELACDLDDTTHRNGFLINEKEGLRKLPALMAGVEKWGVTVTYNGAPLKTVKLDMELEVTAGKQIDWFELKPEITANGKAIPEDVWHRVLAGGVVESDGEVMILDTESTELVDLLGQFFDNFADGKTKNGDDDGAVKIPRLAILDLILMREKGFSLRLPPDLEAIVESLLSGKGTKNLPAPPSLDATLREYQQAGFEWLAFLYAHRFGACLADDMGLGKTIQAISLLAALKDGTIKAIAPASETGPHLIVVPPSLLFNWASEIQRFAPNLTVHEYTGQRRKWPTGKQAEAVDIVLTTYDLVRRDIEKLVDKSFHVVVFDEAQAVKNLRAARSKAARRLHGRFKVCVTGTPVENHAGEYFSIIDLALPGLLGDEQLFRRSIEAEGAASRALQRARLFVLRRTKEKIAKELPAKVEMETKLDLTEQQKQFYTRMVSEIRAEVAEAFAEKPEQQAGIIALTALLRLRQICVTPALIDEDYEEATPKLNFLATTLAQVADEGHAALVFSQFTKTLDVLEPTLAAAGLDFVRLDGSTPVSARKKRIASFMEPKGPPVFLISLKAGGVGLNLTRASYVFHVDPWWNPAVENQATDRAHRIGQDQTVFVNRLIMRHSIEEKMMVLKERKQALFERLLEDGTKAKGGGVITRKDLDFLLDSLPEEAG